MPGLGINSTYERTQLMEQWQLLVENNCVLIKVVIESPLKPHRHVWDVLIKLHVLMYQLSAGENVVGIVAQSYANRILKTFR